MDPRGRTALVSGGTSGLGLAAARLLVAKQANVAVLGIGQVAEAAASLGPDVLGLETDIADQAAVATAVDTVVERFGAEGPGAVASLVMACRADLDGRRGGGLPSCASLHTFLNTYK
jgi:NAD(P)-dependent dehydrogenase (short-subunit alcohol dehydrogenase family)